MGPGVLDRERRRRLGGAEHLERHRHTAEEDASGADGRGVGFGDRRSPPRQIDNDFVQGQAARYVHGAELDVAGIDDPCPEAGAVDEELAPGGIAHRDGDTATAR